MTQVVEALSSTPSTAKKKPYCLPTFTNIVPALYFTESSSHLKPLIWNPFRVFLPWVSKVYQQCTLKHAF
jgi:hypothetical protein